jgi:D-inositol-3-phosphate glycosyltransferase
MSLHRPTKIAMITMHTSPLDQPGTGDAGGLNVYVAETAKRLGEAGVAVDVFTRATSRDQPRIALPAPGVRVVAVPTGPGGPLRKEELPGHIGAFTEGVLGTRGADRYDLVHSHYWLSGQVGRRVARRWSVPLVHTMHTMAKVKNRRLAAQDRPEPLMRIMGEERLAATADRLVANTDVERQELIDLYGAPAGRVDVVHPGVDLTRFTPGDRVGARRRLGWAPERRTLLFVGRLQPLKAPDLLIRAAAGMLADDPSWQDRLQVVVCGGLSGNGLDSPDGLAELARELGVGDLVRLVPPTDRATLAEFYRAADLLVMPSHSESFGLVALEAQACGTPVVAASVGGLSTAVAQGRSGILIDGHDPDRWGSVIAGALDDSELLRELSGGAVAHAAGFSWQATAARTLEVYRSTLAEHGRAVLQGAH